MRREPSRSARSSVLVSSTATRRGSVQAVRLGRSRTPKAVALTVALISLAFALFYISPVFRISKVTVAGAAAVAAEKVVQTAEAEGQNILAVDRDEVIRAVEQIPIVKSARVTRKLPNELVIYVEERQPWAVWQVRAAKYVIDEEGVVIGPPAARPGGTASPPGLITIIDTGNQSLKVGSRVEPKTVELAHRLTQLLPAELGLTIRRFEFTPETGLTVVSDQGWQARFGDHEDVSFKVATLKAILAAVAERRARAEIIDLRYGGRPFYR